MNIYLVDGGWTGDEYEEGQLIYQTRYRDIKWIAAKTPGQARSFVAYASGKEMTEIKHTRLIKKNVGLQLGELSYEEIVFNVWAFLETRRKGRAILKEWQS